MATRGIALKHYTTSWGEIIPGLYRLSDGRWVDQDDRKHPWTSADERDAIREFRRRRSVRTDQRIPVPVTEKSQPDIRDLQQALEQVEDLTPLMTVDFSDRALKVELFPPSHAFWRVMGEVIRNHPQLAAQNTGIKELAWIEDLQPPPGPLSLDE